ncbi:MAG: ferredoxin, partial [Kiloniellales bacterium]|nr:ferredoxin [Kiloniellales bacterium]
MLERIAAALASLGLILRGGFRPDPEDAVPALRDAAAAGTLLLVGNAGPAMWQAFQAAPEAADRKANPLDRWIARGLGALAEDLGAEARFPFEGPPYLPFQRWAAKAEGLKASPLGILIHPRFGLWHAYRGAFAFREALPLPISEAAPCPCDACVEKPCLQGCPVGAFADGS